MAEGTVANPKYWQKESCCFGGGGSDFRKHRPLNLLILIYKIHRKDFSNFGRKTNMGKLRLLLYIQKREPQKIIGSLGLQGPPLFVAGSVLKCLRRRV